MDKIFNLTQHLGTTEQINDGLVEPFDKKQITDLLTFHSIPTAIDISMISVMLKEIVLKSGCKKAMIGGAPYLMSTLEKVLKESGITPLYSFTSRIVKEEIKDGVTTKTSIFKHTGWVEV